MFDPKKSPEQQFSKFDEFSAINTELINITRIIKRLNKRVSQLNEAVFDMMCNEPIPYTLAPHTEAAIAFDTLPDAPKQSHHALLMTDTVEDALFWDAANAPCSVCGHGKVIVIQPDYKCCYCSWCGDDDMEVPYE